MERTELDLKLDVTSNTEYDDLTKVRGAPWRKLRDEWNAMDGTMLNKKFYEFAKGYSDADLDLLNRLRKA